MALSLGEAAGLPAVKSDARFHGLNIWAKAYLHIDERTKPADAS
jgi:hypothetical protein